MTRAKLIAFFKARRANAAVEFALTVPVMLIFMGGIVELGRAFQAYNAVNRLASRYASSWADCSDTQTSACNTEISQYTSSYTLQNLAPQLSPVPTVRMIEVQMSGSTPTIIYKSTGVTALTQAETDAVVAASQNTTQVGTAGLFVVVVTVQYTFQVKFFQSLWNGINSNFNGRTISYTVAQLRS